MSNQNFQKGNLYLIIAIIVGVVAISTVGFASWKYFGGGSELGKNRNEITKPLIEKESEESEIVDETEPYIKVISPNGGEKWIIGNNYEIKWKSSLNIEKKVDIYLIKEGKWNLANYIAFSVPNTGMYNWDLTDTEDNLIQMGDNYKIQVFVRKGKPGESDESDNYFSIKEKSKSENISIFIDAESFDLVNKSFEGQTQSESKNVKVLTADSTKFYRGVYDEGKFIVDNYYTFSEFYSLLKNWNGPPWPFTVKGVFEKSGVIKADEIFFIAQ